MNEETFSIRLAKLRLQKGVSAREMSLAIGQNPGYINNIESGKSFPSMSCFFYICEYLKISPQDFFNLDSENPRELEILISNLKKLNEHQLKCISDIVDELILCKK